MDRKFIDRMSFGSVNGNIMTYEVAVEKELKCGSTSVCKVVNSRHVLDNFFLFRFPFILGL